MATRSSFCQPLMNIECQILSHGCFIIFLNLISGWGWCPWQQDGESISLSSEGIQRLDYVESLYEINFTLLSQTKRHNVHNFAFSGCIRHGFKILYLT